MGISYDKILNVVDKAVCPTSEKFPLRVKFYGNEYADMAELADALDSGSNSCKAVQVQVLLSAPKTSNPLLWVACFFVCEEVTGLEPAYWQSQL